MSGVRRDGFSRFTTVVSITSVALGCLALIVAMSVLGGYDDVIVQTAQRFGAPLELRPLSARYVGNVAEIQQFLQSVPGVRSTEVLLEREALARTHEGVDGALISNISESNRDILQRLLVTGRLPQPTSSTLYRVAIGEQLARRLAVGVGDTVVLYTAESSDGSTPPLLSQAVITGVLRSGMERFDATIVLMPHQDAVRCLAVPPDAANGIGIRLVDNVVEEDVQQALARRLPQGFYLQTTRQRFASMDAWIDLQREPIPIVLGLISIVATFTVIAALLMAAVEKTRDVAILRTLGLRTSTLAGVFLWQSLRLSLTGIAIGSTVAFLLCVAQDQWSLIRLDGAIYYVSVLPVRISALPYAIVTTTTMLFSTVASMAPLLMTSRLKIVEVLRFS
ncbi:MAG: ABC transporter permease [Candidatus Kapabacteria bacterium]|nr:ABC transporter permease [Candidatus Kapabacteria bacterium]